MALQYHPKTGTIVICDYHGFIAPEMVKRRPAIVISPDFGKRNGLCTIVPLSTTPPNPEMPYHCKIELKEPLPSPYDSPFHWVKGDMVVTVSFNRLSLPFKGKNIDGKRNYIKKVVRKTDLQNIRKCVLHAIALSYLTKYL